MFSVANIWVTTWHIAKKIWTLWANTGLWYHKHHEYKLDTLTSIKDTETLQQDFYIWNKELLTMTCIALLYRFFIA